MAGHDGKEGSKAQAVLPQALHASPPFYGLCTVAVAPQDSVLAFASCLLC